MNGPVDAKTPDPEASGSLRTRRIRKARPIPLRDREANLTCGRFQLDDRNASRDVRVYVAGRRSRRSPRQPFRQSTLSWFTSSWLAGSQANTTPRTNRRRDRISPNATSRREVAERLRAACCKRVGSTSGYERKRERSIRAVVVRIRGRVQLRCTGNVTITSGPVAPVSAVTGMVASGQDLTRC